MPLMHGSITSASGRSSPLVKGRRPATLAITVLTLLFFLMSGSCAFGQIGNLNWASGKKASKKKNKLADYENSKFQMFMEPGVGKAKMDYESQSLNYDSTWDTYSDSYSDLMLDLAMGGVYQAYRTTGNGPRIDASVYFSVGADLTDFDFESLHLMAVIAPEIGVLLPSSSNLAIRPFVSFGPGFSFLNNIANGNKETDYFYSSGDNEEFFELVTIMRAGIEFGQKKGPYSVALSVKKIGRGETKYSSTTSKSTRKFSDLLFTLGFRIKL